jgi:hypothetical protein
MKRIISTTKVLVATAVVAVALLANCGGDDSGEARSTSAAERVDAPAGARLEAQAEQYERSAHLQGQARTYGARAERQHAARPNPIEAGTGPSPSRSSAAPSWKARPGPTARPTRPTRPRPRPTRRPTTISCPVPGTCQCADRSRAGGSSGTRLSLTMIAGG